MPSRDYEEFIASLNAHSVRYLVVGAHAVAHHARPRATKDLDILFDPDPGNVRRLLDAMREFFGGTPFEYTVEDLTDPQSILQLGVAPVRIDLLPRIPGFDSFSEAWRGRVEGRFGSIPAPYLGLADLIRAKEAAGRPRDRADLHVLRRVAEGSSPADRPRRRTARPRGGGRGRRPRG